MLSDRFKDKTLISLDTEFIDTGTEIALISVGMVREDGAELYLENRRFFADHEHLIDDWTAQNTLAKTFLQTAPDDPRIVDKSEMGEQILRFCLEGGKEPSIWAHYASYDWVALCQVWGPMLSIPTGMPYHAMDFRVAQDLLGVKAPSQEPVNHHHALIDARWGKRAFAALGLPFAQFDAERDQRLPEPEPSPRLGM